MAASSAQASVFTSAARATYQPTRGGGRRYLRKVLSSIEELKTDVDEWIDAR